MAKENVVTLSPLEKVVCLFCKKRKLYLELRDGEVFVWCRGCNTRQRLRFKKEGKS